jgi:hypothetical protein
MDTVVLLRTGGFPLCFSSASQYRSWKASAQQVKPGDSKYCADCTPAYQGDMIRQGRCAYPGTTFHVTADGFLDGVRPGCRLPNRKKEVA